MTVSILMDWMKSQHPFVQISAQNIQIMVFLASKIIISNHQKNTSPSFSETIDDLYNAVDIHNEGMKLISDSLYKIVLENKREARQALVILNMTEITLLITLGLKP